MPTQPPHAAFSSASPGVSPAVTLVFTIYLLVLITTLLALLRRRRALQRHADENCCGTRDDAAVLNSATTLCSAYEASSATAGVTLNAGEPCCADRLRHHYRLHACRSARHHLSTFRALSNYASVESDSDSDVGSSTTASVSSSTASRTAQTGSSDDSLTATHAAPRPSRPRRMHHRSVGGSRSSEQTDAHQHSRRPSSRLPQHSKNSSARSTASTLRRDKAALAMPPLSAPDTDSTHEVCDSSERLFRAHSGETLRDEASLPADACAAYEADTEAETDCRTRRAAVSNAGQTDHLSTAAVSSAATRRLLGLRVHTTATSSALSLADYSPTPLQHSGTGCFEPSAVPTPLTPAAWGEEEREKACGHAVEHAGTKTRGGRPHSDAGDAAVSIETPTAVAPQLDSQSSFPVTRLHSPRPAPEATAVPLSPVSTAHHFVGADGVAESVGDSQLIQTPTAQCPFSLRSRSASCDWHTASAVDHEGRRAENPNSPLEQTCFPSLACGAPAMFAPLHGHRCGSANNMDSSDVAMSLPLLSPSDELVGDGCEGFAATASSTALPEEMTIVFTH